MQKEKIKKILQLAGYDDEVIFKVIFDIQNMVRETELSRRLRRKLKKVWDENTCFASELVADQFESISDILNFNDEVECYEYDLPAIFKTNIAFDFNPGPNLTFVAKQLAGEMPVEHSVYEKPEEFYQVNVNKNIIKFWIDLSERLLKKYQYEKSKNVKIFIKLLKDALNANINAFEIPVGCPGIDEWNRLSFGDVEKEIAFYDFENCSYNNISVFVRNTPGIALGTIIHFVLYVVSIMNDAVRSGKNPKKVFEKVVVGKFENEFENNIISNLGWDIKNVIVDSTNTCKVIDVSLPFKMEKVCEKTDDVAFFPFCIKM